MSSGHPPEDRTSLRPPSSLKGEEEAASSAPWTTMPRKQIRLEDLREEFLAHCESRNLSGRTLEWYDDRTGRFADSCATERIDSRPDHGSSFGGLSPTGRLRIEPDG
jgi:hypothetical protein